MAARRSSFVGFLLLGVIVITLPLIVFFSQQQQKIEQHAAGNLSIPTDGEGVYDDCDPFAIDCIAHLKIIAQGEFKLVLNYGSLYGNAQQLLAYASAAQTAGVKIIWGLHNSVIWKDNNPAGTYGALAASCGCNDSATFARYVVNLVKNHPATWGYYVGDELGIADHTQLKAYSDIIHQTDPTHPRLFIGDANADPSAYVGDSPYWDSAEVIGDDYYPIGRPASQAPLNSATYTGTVAQKIQIYATQHSRDSAIVLQALNWGDYASDPWVKSWCGSSPFPCGAMHYPTYDELNILHSLTLQNMHPRLILWYSYFDTMRTANAASHWNDLSTVVKSTISNTPTPSLTPIVPPSSSGTTFQVVVCPHGLGNCGDNANLNSTGNAAPKHQQRSVTLTLLDASNNPVNAQQGTVSYTSSASAGSFQGTVSLGNVANGSYLVKIKTDGYLPRQVPGIVTLTTGQTITIPSISLIAGDINNDGQLDILDYNILTSCFGSKQNTSSCTMPPTSQSAGADIDDDGTVSGVDYNLFLRELSVQHGG